MRANWCVQTHPTSRPAVGDDQRDRGNTHHRRGVHTVHLRHLIRVLTGAGDDRCGRATHRIAGRTWNVDNHSLWGCWRQVDDASDSYHRPRSGLGRGRGTCHRQAHNATGLLWLADAGGLDILPTAKAGGFRRGDLGETTGEIPVNLLQHHLV